MKRRTDGKAVKLKDKDTVTKALLEISDGSPNNRYRVYSVWRRRDVVLVHHYSKSEILESFPVHPRLCHYLGFSHRFGQHNFRNLDLGQVS